jgi:hypothetical protein
LLRRQAFVWALLGIKSRKVPAINRTIFTLLKLVPMLSSIDIDFYDCSLLCTCVLYVYPTGKICDCFTISDLYISYFTSCLLATLFARDGTDKLCIRELKSYLINTIFYSCVNFGLKE